jgi:hypothetical protein
MADDKNLMEHFKIYYGGSFDIANTKIQHSANKSALSSEAET